MFLKECRTSVTKLRGIGSVAASALAKAGIKQVWEFLECYPRKYIDRTVTVPFRDFSKSEVNTVAEVIARDYIQFKGKRVLKVYLQDKSAEAAIVCFGRNYLENKLVRGAEIFISGSFQHRYSEIQSSNFEFEEYSDNPRSFGKILPVYPLTGKLTQGHMRTAMGHAVHEYVRFIDNEIPAYILKEYGLPDKKEALTRIHFPDSIEKAEKAAWALKFEELFYFQIIMTGRTLKRKSGQKHRSIREFSGSYYLKAVDSLPFSLTNDQLQVIEEIKADLGGGMNRLLQGDVGAGKTLVALLVAALAKEKKWQTALMAPTELLAQQHAATAAALLSPLGVNAAYISGGIAKDQKKNLLHALSSGEIDLVVGTHSLFSEDMEYSDLRLIIIDEQQRFGVNQREQLYSKGNDPDILLMTATPIPRTLALTAFGDMDISTIKTMPPGRLPVITHLARHGNEQKVYDFVQNELKQGHQAYFVYPLLQESESLDLKAAQSMADELSERYPQYKCALVHGRLKEEEKNRAMTAFKNNEIQILVATSVVEVGVDVANATCMIIEHAERFGLSALHQLRGRVGRSDIQSYAFLVYSENLTEDGKARLKIMKDTTDGFRIAEEDLKIRGPGELLGARQSGYIPFKIADPVTDLDLLLKNRDLCSKILKEDPGLLSPENAVIREVLNKVHPFQDE